MENWIIRDTEAKGDKLFHAIMNYKTVHGFYPSSLDDSYFDEYSRFALVRRPFIFEKYKTAKADTSFNIRVLSFNGMAARRHSTSNGWNYND